MKNIIICTIFIMAMTISGFALAAKGPTLKLQSLGKKFASTVEKNVKTELSQLPTDSKEKHKFLIQQLKELMDKDLKRI